MAWPLPAEIHPCSETVTQPLANDHRCSVCLELFTEPKVLPCCHTFCLECLKKTASSESTKGQVTCPQCRQSYPIPEGGLTDFLTDFIANYEVEVAGLSSPKGGGKSTVCGECEEAVAVSHFCSDCQNYLCDECGLQLHKRLKTFRGHKVVPISEISAATLQSCQVHYCAFHKGEILKLYCETCNKLVCRDCTLVDHRQHSYKFLEDARKQLEAEMAALKVDVEKKLSVMELDLEEIKKVEIAATGHPHVVKADINLYFDGVVRLIEARRAALLKEAEEACQKDLKQVWADKEFHEATIGHIGAVFKLVDKAHKCTSDSEMILTSIQGITQLRVIKAKEWDGKEFVRMVHSAPSFKKKKASVESFGGVVHVSSPSKEMEISVPNKIASLKSFFQINVACSSIKSLVDVRSGENVNLQKGVRFSELEVIVQYGKAKKELNSSLVVIEKISELQPAEELLYGTAPKVVYYGRQPRRGRQQTKTNVTTRGRSCGSSAAVPTPVAPTASDSKAKSNSQTYKVRIRLVCGGTHTAIFRYGNSEITHTFTVEGQLQNGDRVRKGPDWKPRAENQPRFPNILVPSTMGGVVSQPHYGDEEEEYFEAMHNDGGIGNVYMETYIYGGHSRYNYGNYSQVEMGTTVTVQQDAGNNVNYKWGKDGEYEIELCL